MNPVPLNWILTNSNNEYFRLKDVDLDNSHFDNLRGVYIIWCPREIQRMLYAKAVYVGKAHQGPSGLIKHRLADHRNTYSEVQGTLYVTWAGILSEFMPNIDGIESFLHAELSPLDGHPPAAPPIIVNLPVLNLSWY